MLSVGNTCYFTIIVPVYNTEKYLRHCLDSILSQTFEDYEVILINDGSTDDSAAICREYAKKDERIRVVEQENKGLLQVRRVGLKAAKGKYIMHIDSDDSCKKIMLEHMYNYTQQYNADMIIFNYDLVDDNDSLIKTVKPSVYNLENNVFEKESKDKLVKAFIEGYELNNLVTKCAKREIYDINVDYSKYGRLSMGEDALQSIPLIENAKKIVYIDESLYLYRYNQAGMSRSIKKSYIFDYIHIQKRTREMLKSLNMSFLNELSEVKYVHRIISQLLQLIVVCKNKEEYCDIYERTQKVKDVNMKSYFEKLSVSDKVGYYLVKPSMYGISKRISKIYFANK